MTPEELGSKQAYPIHGRYTHLGMTYRQYLLGCALQGLLARGSSDTRATDAAEIAKAAVDTLLFIESEAMNRG